MNELLKTIAFVFAAIVAVTAALLVGGSAQDETAEQLVGQTLNADIKPTDPTRLQVIKFDRGTATVRRFEVAEVDGVWSLPEKEDYPADAVEQMADAVTGVMDRKILRIAGASAESHEEFGVVDPLAERLDSKSLGVGTRVIMTGANDKRLVDMVIGKAVKDSPGQRYVRRMPQDVVYVVELDPERLSTDFADWIEDDLLAMDALSTRRLFINDYEADLSFSMQDRSLHITRERRHEITLAHPEDDAQWEVAGIKRFDAEARDMVEDVLAEDEEVNQDVVRELINALDDLLIVDVARKPEGLSADLKAGENFLTNDEAATDLATKGFIPVALESGADILSSEGEVICTLSDGVEYVLRFGQLQVQTESAGDTPDEDAAEAEAAAEDAADAAAEEDSDAENLRRYLFVMARFNADAIAPPALQDVPPMPDQEPADEAEPAADEAAAGEAAAEEDEATDEAEGDEAAAEGDAAAEVDEAATEGDAAEADESDDEAVADEESAEAADDVAEEADGADELDREARIAEIADITAANDRLMEEYNAAVTAGRDRVTDLNERFGDWYFVISNDVYKKIHLGREQVIKKKDPPAAEGAEGAAGDVDPDATSGLPEIPAGLLEGAAGEAEATGEATEGEPEAEGEPAEGVDGEAEGAAEDAAAEPAATEGAAEEPAGAQAQ